MKDQYVVDRYVDEDTWEEMQLNITFKANHQMHRALCFAKQGWHIFPAMHDCTPYIENWKDLATTNVNTISAWWNQFPHAEIAVLIGPSSGFWVIEGDIFNKFPSRYQPDNIFQSDYVAGFSQCEKVQYYYQWESTLPVLSQENVVPGINIKGEGDYILAPTVYLARQMDEFFDPYTSIAEIIPPGSMWAQDVAIKSFTKDQIYP